MDKCELGELKWICLSAAYAQVLPIQVELLGTWCHFPSLFTALVLSYVHTL